MNGWMRVVIPILATAIIGAYGFAYRISSPHGERIAVVETHVLHVAKELAAINQKLDELIRERRGR